MQNDKLESIASTYKAERPEDNMREAYVLLAQATARLVAAYRSTGDRSILEVANLSARAQTEILSVTLQEVAK